MTLKEIINKLKELGVETIYEAVSDFTYTAFENVSYCPFKKYDDVVDITIEYNLFYKSNSLWWHLDNGYIQKKVAGLTVEQFSKDFYVYPADERYVKFI